MGPVPNRQLRAFTLVELLICIAIVTMLLQLMLPAVANSRESARRLQCSGNQRQLGQAIQNYESAQRVLPPGFVLSPHRHNYVQYILPHLEQTAAFAAYDFTADWDDPVNKTVVDMEIELARCPTTPTFHPFVADYSVYVRVDPTLMTSMSSQGILKPRSDSSGALRSMVVQSALIADGLSNTIFLCETAGRPDKWVLGSLQKEGNITGGRWASPAGRFEVHYLCDGRRLNSGRQLINCTSKNEIYSFHSGGANFLFGDGSVRFLAETTDADVIVSLLTAQAQD
jgi:prepilin-type processing-associated H-X9-DG protein/prepilin-type N-terminal cleavage/methylation domain-containing protein